MPARSVIRARIALAAAVFLLLAASAGLWRALAPSASLDPRAPDTQSPRRARSERDESELGARVELGDASADPAAGPGASAKEALGAATKRTGSAVITLSELDGRPIAGARISLGGTDKPVLVASRASAIADEHGIAEFPEVEVGVWEIWWKRAQPNRADAQSPAKIVALARAGAIEIVEGQTRYHDLIVGGPRRVELSFVFTERPTLVMNIKLVRASSGEVVRRDSWMTPDDASRLLTPLVFEDLEPDLYQVHFALDTTEFASCWEPVDVLAADAKLGPWKLDYDDFPFAEVMRENWPRDKSTKGFWFDNLPELDEVEEELDRKQIQAFHELSKLLEDARRPGYRGPR